MENLIPFVVSLLFVFVAVWYVWSRCKLACKDVEPSIERVALDKKAIENAPPIFYIKAK